jgi:dTDP-glucose 4,6-dehydratase
VTTILVTGGAGFIGSNFVRYVLDHTDWSVVVLDKLDEAGTCDRLAPARWAHPGRIEFFWHDLRAPINPVMLRRHGEFRYVVHLAAGSHVDRSVRDPVGFVMDNVVGTAHLLEYVRQHQSAEKTLYFSTDEVFGPAPEGVEFDEHSPHTPNNPYAAAKAGGEALIPAWANTYGMPLVVTHCTNVYGPGQYGEKFIPLVADKLIRGETIQIHARDGIASSRYYVHVDDVSRAVLTVLEKGGIWGGPLTGKYNITGDVEWSNRHVADSIASILQRPIRTELVEHVPNRPRHDMRYAIGGEKLRALGWAPTVPLMAGLRQVLLGSALPEAERAIPLSA